jgi:hypothetical protein
LLETAREGSVAVASRDIAVADLNQEDLLLEGAVEYNEMCSAGHLQPGQQSIELYTRHRQLLDNKARYKSLGHARLGPTHSDELIWVMVAFLQKLPDMSAK